MATTSAPAHLPPERTTGKTGGMGTEWVCFDSPKPPAVPDPYLYWTQAPPERSPRCEWWLHQIRRGWRPNKHVRANNYDGRAHWFGIYIWEYIHVIDPALDESPCLDENPGR